eukprot:g30260.t1
MRCCSSSLRCHLTLEEAQDAHVTQEVRRGVKMVRDRAVFWFVACRAQMLSKTVSESTLGLTDVEEATSGAMDAVDQVDRCAGRWVRGGVVQVSVGVGGLEIDVVEVVTRDEDGKVQEGEGGIGDGSGEFEVGVKGVSKVDELSKLLV